MTCYQIRMIALLLLLGSAIIASEAAAAEALASGTVYRDDNGNGLRDEGEAGIAGVLVSNGRDIVSTDSAGRYQVPLAHADDSMVFVLKPAHYRLPVDHDFVPRFWYQHDPDGTPNRRYAGAPATGPLPQEINFALIPAQESSRFQVALMADPQVKNEDEVGYYRRAIVQSLANRSGYVMGFSLGDIVHDDLNLYPAMNQSTAELGVPWFNVFGNHDMNLDAATDRGSDDTFESFYGPTTYALQYADVHFIYFDDVVHWLDSEGQPRYYGGLTDDQLLFIKNYLTHVEADELVVLMMHIPLVDDDGDNRIRKRDQQRLSQLLSGFQHTLSVSGHSHIQQHLYIGSEDGWQGSEPHYHYNLGTASGSWWSGDLDADGLPMATMQDGTPNGYAIIQFDGNEYQISYHAARENNMLRIYGPGPIIRGSYPQADVYVNAYNAEPEDRVEYRIDNGAWISMQRVLEKDPFVLAQNLRRMNQTLPPNNERLSAALPSTHLWKARLSTDLLPGAHLLQVRTNDRYGRTHQIETNIQVVEIEPVH